MSGGDFSREKKTKGRRYGTIGKKVVNPDMQQLKKHREVINYLFFGVATTVVNYVVYFLATKTFSLDFKLSNLLAWFFSVLFAFITNKLWVFQSKTASRRLFFKELGLFYWYRVLSLFIDMGLMMLLISGLHWPDFWAKTLTQVVIVAANYLFSKWFIFKKRGDGPL